MEEEMIYPDVATSMNKAAADLHAAQDEARTIELAIRDSLALIKDTRRAIAYLDRLSRWRVRQPSFQR